MKAFLFFALGCSAQLFALPSGGQVVQGDAAIVSSPDLLQIEANGKVILHWEGFDLGSQETVRFSQSRDRQAVLNRVTGGLSSQIFGRLEANCPVYLVNPDGIFIGPSAAIATAGFIASTSDLSNDCFWQGDLLLFDRLGSGSIVNLGKIQSIEGDVFLIARSIDNQGDIEVKNGFAAMVTSEVMLYPETKRTLFIRCTPEEGEIQNSGTIRALSVELKTQSPYEKAIQHDGLIEAMDVAHSNGRIYLIAREGGCRLNAPLAAPDGAIDVEASLVHLTKKALLDVSSETRGGDIRIAPGRITADEGSRLLASATVKGNGGTISIAAENQLFFFGEAYVCGGAEGGNGGSIHLSSKGPLFQLDPHHPVLRASATKGRFGKVFFDPKFVTIAHDGLDPATGNTFASIPSDSVIISGSALQAALDGANVVIQANTDIFFQDTVEATTMGNSLTLQAGRSIQMAGQLTLNDGDFTATINDSGAVVSDRDSGVASFQLSSQGGIATQGGTISIGIGTFGGQQIGEIYLNGGTLDAGGGDIVITGIARQDSADDAYGISMGSGAVLQTIGMGGISLQGTGGNGATNNAGVMLQGGLLQTDGGLLQIVGTGGGNGMGNGSVGIYSAAQISSLGSGPISLQGTAGSGVHGNMGVYLGGGGIDAVDGNIDLQGTGSGTGALNFGVRMDSGVECNVAGTGSIALTGVSGVGRNNNHGVSLSGCSLSTDTGSIAITGTGRGSVGYNYGIRMEGDSALSTANGPISLNGQNTSGTVGNAGVSISVSGIAVSSGYGDVEITGVSAGTTLLNQGIRQESGQIVSTGTGIGSANIHLIGVGGMGTDYCNGVAVEGFSSAITSIDGNIVLEGTAQGSGAGNQPLSIDPSSLIEATGIGTVTYIEH